MKRSTVGVAAAALALVLTAGLGAFADASDNSALMANSATRFLATLTPEQLERTRFAFDSEERLRRHFIPTEMFARQGLMVRDMGEDQRRAAHDLLRAGLSMRGYMTVSEIMEAEGILRELEGEERRFGRDPEQYYLSVFGTPSATGSWGWRWEGHHLSLHFTVVDGNATVSAPTFLSASPAEVPSGPRRGMRPLGRQEDAGRALLGSLTPEQRSVAVFEETAPRDLVANPTRPADPLSPIGIAATELTSAQRTLLMEIVESYIDLMADDIAELRRAKIARHGTDDITFAWAGGTLRGEVSYFRVQGPSFLIEFDNTANDPNHVHSAWRDFDGDFGRDLISEHLAQVEH